MTDKKPFNPQESLLEALTQEKTLRAAIQSTLDPTLEMAYYQELLKVQTRLKRIQEEAEKGTVVRII